MKFYLKFNSNFISIFISNFIYLFDFKFNFFCSFLFFILNYNSADIRIMGKVNLGEFILKLILSKKIYNDEILWKKINFDSLPASRCLGSLLEEDSASSELRKLLYAVYDENVPT